MKTTEDYSYFMALEIYSIEVTYAFISSSISKWSSYLSSCATVVAAILIYTRNRKIFLNYKLLFENKIHFNDMQLKGNLSSFFNNLYYYNLTINKTLLHYFTDIF